MNQRNHHRPIEAKWPKATDPDHVTIEGSLGILIVNKTTGLVMVADYQSEPDQPEDDYRRITRFNADDIAGDSDILNVGYWFKNLQGVEEYQPKES